MNRREFLATAAAAAPLFRRQAKEEVALFDGRSLAGWHKNPAKIGHGTGGSWKIEEQGVLVAEQDLPGSGNGGILLTDKKFGDFELTLEVKPDWGVDSGIFLRTTDAGQCRCAAQSRTSATRWGSAGQPPRSAECGQPLPLLVTMGTVSGSPRRSGSRNMTPKTCWATRLRR